MAGAQFVKKKPDVVSALRPAFFIQYLESCISRLNVIPCHDLTLSVGEPDNAAAKLRSEQTVTPLHEQSPATYFLRLNNLETFVELVGARPLHLLSQTVLPLKSPTGAFIAALCSANAVAPNAKSKIAIPLIMRKATRSAFQIVPFAKAKSRRTTRCTAVLLTI